MEDYVYVILVLVGVEVVTLLGAGIWILVLGAKAQDLQADICDRDNEIRGLQRMQDIRDKKAKGEASSDDEALADFDSHDVNPLLPDGGGG